MLESRPLLFYAFALDHVPAILDTHIYRCFSLLLQLCIDCRPNNVPVVIEHSCSCKGGQGICNHKIAFLYQAAHYSMLGLKTVPAIPSRTSLPQEWHKPRTAGVAPECSQEIQLRKPELKLNKGRKRSFDGVKSSLYNPISSNFPPKKFIDNFQREILCNFLETQFSSLFPSDASYIESKFGLVPNGSVISYQQKLATDYSHIKNIPQWRDFPDLPTRVISTLGYTTVLPTKESIYYAGEQITLEETRRIEKETRDQSDNPYWHDLRKKRITASKFKRVAARKKDYETLVAQLKKPVRQTEVMRYGLANEGSAAVTYAESKGVNVRRSGFVINPGCPHLGASPDYIVFDPNENDDPFGLMKAKCLQCLSVRIAKCLRLVNGELKLRKTHEYYYQIQGQLGLTGMQWCDLMVLCKDDWHIERIYFDEEFFNSMCSNLDKFYFDFFLCTLV